MGDRTLISDLEEGQKVDQAFAVREKDLRRTSTGSLYVACTLTDRSGQIAARVWQATEADYDAIPLGEAVFVKGRVERYRKELQLVVDSVRPAGEGEAPLTDLVPSTGGDVGAMWQELLALLREIENPHLRALVDRFLADEELMARFKAAPAASQMHHAYVGGLLEHTLAVVRLARAILPIYPVGLSADLLLAGAFLHDIGKAEELVPGVAMTYSERGQLVGHIAAAALWIKEKADEVAKETGEPFPQRVLDLVQHLVLSHHGAHEYGSPKLPMIPEAFALHYVDNLDAKVHMAIRAIAADSAHEGSFTAFQRGLDVRVYKRSGDLPR